VALLNSGLDGRPVCHPVASLGTPEARGDYKHFVCVRLMGRGFGPGSNGTISVICVAPRLLRWGRTAIATASARVGA